jgi:hypothetical protein
MVPFQIVLKNWKVVFAGMSRGMRDPGQNGNNVSFVQPQHSLITWEKEIKNYYNILIF